MLRFFVSSVSSQFPGTDIVDISQLIPYLAKFWFSSFLAKCCWSIKLQHSLKHNSSRKKWMMEFICGMQILILSFWVCVASHAQSQNSKFAIFLQYLKENANNEGNFLLADEHRRFLQIDTRILGVCGQVYPNHL